MIAKVGDRIVIESQKVGTPTREGDILRGHRGVLRDPLQHPLGRRPREHNPPGCGHRANDPQG